MTFSNENDLISFRHHVFVKTSPKEVQLAEVGPRFELKPYEIRQGTVEQTEAEREWVLSHYTRTARKRSMLSNPTASRSGNDEQADTRPSKNGPVDLAVRAKVFLLMSSLSLLHGHKVSLLKAGPRVQRIPRKRK